MGEIRPEGRAPRRSGDRLDPPRRRPEVVLRPGESLALKAIPPRLALADACLRDVIARDPGHAEAHRLLGFVPHEGGWATPFAASAVEGRAWSSHSDLRLAAQGLDRPPRPRRAARPVRPRPADPMAARRPGRRGPPPVREGLADHHRALPDPDQRPARRGDRLRPPARGAGRAVLVADGRPRRPRTPADGPARQEPEGRADRPQEDASDILFRRQGRPIVEFLGRVHGPGFDQSLGCLPAGQGDEAAPTGSARASSTATPTGNSP